MDKPIILSEEEIEAGLKDLPGWTYAENKISKEYKFTDFMGAFTFVSALAPYFEQMDHHPDIHIFYNRIVFELQRFDIGGRVTDRDLTVAGEIERRYSSR